MHQVKCFIGLSRIKGLASPRTFIVPKQSRRLGAVPSPPSFFTQLTNHTLCVVRQRFIVKVQMKAVDCDSRILLCVSDKQAGSLRVCLQWQMFSPVTFRSQSTLQTCSPLFLWIITSSCDRIAASVLIKHLLKCFLSARIDNVRYDQLYVYNIYVQSFILLQARVRNRKV